MKKLIEFWSKIKQWIDNTGKYSRIKEGHICWAYLGQNIGSETFGKGEFFRRPVLIISVIFKNSAIVIPLTSKPKDGFLYYNFVDSKGQTQYALLYQIRYLDGKRINEKFATLSKSQMKNLKIKLSKILKI